MMFCRLGKGNDGLLGVLGWKRLLIFVNYIFYLSIFYLLIFSLFLSVSGTPKFNEKRKSDAEVSPGKRF